MMMTTDPYTFALGLVGSLTWAEFGHSRDAVEYQVTEAAHSAGHTDLGFIDLAIEAAQSILGTAVRA